MDIVFTLAGLLTLLAWFYLALGHGLFWLPLVDKPAPEPEKWPSVDVIVPARNEAESLPRSLPLLLLQNYPGLWKIFLIDDHSSDGTAHIAKQLAFTLGRADKLVVLSAPELREGWSGKVAAMNTGVQKGTSDYILLTDADIEHPPDSLRHLAARATHDKLDLVSIMVKLHCTALYEKFLIPAFVFFFAMLYPFRRANNPASPVAAAAGGVMLVRREALKNAGGLERIKPAIIDDCALARIIKDNGGEESTTGKIRLTLSHDIKSLRFYPKLQDITGMISRTAFTQLRHSPYLLVFTVLGMAVLFLCPLVLPLIANAKTAMFGYGAWILMTLIYWPMVRFYGLSWIWALTLPAAALIYMAATVDSARQYWRGQGGQWKGRAQAQ